MSAAALMDDMPFFGPSAPAEVKKAISLLPKLSDDAWKVTLKLVVDYLRGDDLEAERFAKEYEDTGLDRPNAIALFTGIYTLFRLAIRKRIKPQKFSHDLKELKVPGNAVSDLTELFSSW